VEHPAEPPSVLPITSEAAAAHIWKPFEEHRGELALRGVSGVGPSETISTGSTGVLGQNRAIPIARESAMIGAHIVFVRNSTSPAAERIKMRDDTKTLVSAHVQLRDHPQQPSTVVNALLLFRIDRHYGRIVLWLA